MEEFVIKIKRSELLTVVALIMQLFALVVFFIGMVSKATEPILEASIMFVASIIFDCLNEGTFVINQKGVVTDKAGVFKWKDIELLTISKAFIRLKIANEKTLRFEVALNENRKKLNNASRYIDSKLKSTNDEYEIELEKRRHVIEEDEE